MTGLVRHGQGPAGDVAAPRRTRYTPWRRTTQTAIAVLFLVLPFVGSTAVAGSLVALKLGPIDVTEPASALSAAVAARVLPASLAVAVVPLVALAVVLGPVYCSWACPFGFASELLDRARRRRAWVAPGSPPRHRRVAVVVVLVAASALLGVPITAIVAPPRLLTALPLELRAAGAVPAVSVTLLAAVAAVELFGPRRIVFRTLCPAGTVAAILRNRLTLAPHYDPARCRCPEVAPCFRACPWGIDPRSMRPEDGCTTCLACLDRCPTRALSLSRLTRSNRTLDTEGQ